MKLTFPAGRFNAYLFDCDGTIADTMPLHYRAWKAAMQEWNYDFSEDLFYDWAGIPVVRAVEMLNERYGLRMPPKLVSDRREEHYLQLLDQVKPVPAVVDEVLKMHGKIPLAVVSGSPRDSVMKTLTHLGLQNHFQTILGAEDYRNGKPHPEPYLKAAELVGVPPAECLVFEDGILGIESAKAAGMGHVFVPSRVIKSAGANAE